LLSRIGAALPDERFGDIPSVPIRRPVSGGGLSSSPNLERPAAAVGTIAFVFLRPRAARSRWREAVGQTRRLARSGTKSTTARFWRGSNQSSKAVDRREAALHDLGLETAGARLWLFYKAISLSDSHATERSSVSDPFGVGAGDRFCPRPALGRWAGRRLLRTRF
jgi:hypothetical protein